MTEKYPNLTEKYLDAEKLFRKYIEMGEGRTIELLTEWAILEGMESSTGKKPTPMGVWKSIWRWASTHKDEAWELAKDHTFGTKANPFKYDWQRWKTEMIKIRIPTAWQHPTVAKKEKFMKEHGWL